MNKGTIATLFVDGKSINSKAASMRQLTIAAGYESLDVPAMSDRECL